MKPESLKNALRGSNGAQHWHCLYSVQIVVLGCLPHVRTSRSALLTCPQEPSTSAAVKKVTACSFLPLACELFCEVVRQRGILPELHGEAGSTLGHAPEVSDVLEHLRQRDKGCDQLDVPAVADAIPC